MIENSTSVYFGGLTIITQFSKEVPYHIVVKSPGIIWEGSACEFEAMCESHKLLIGASLQMLHAKNSDDYEEEVNSLYIIKEALRRADVLPPEKVTDPGDDNDFPF